LIGGAWFTNQGCLIYEMLAGEPPFKNPNKKILLKWITEKEVPMRKDFSLEAISLLQGLLKKDTLERLGSG